MLCCVFEENLLCNYRYSTRPFYAEMVSRFKESARRSAVKGVAEEQRIGHDPSVVHNNGTPVNNFSAGMTALSRTAPTV